MKRTPLASLARLLVCTALALLAACASVVHSPATLDASDTAVAPVRTLSAALAFTLDTGFERTLPAASRWRRAGAIVEGTVYQPYQDVFTLEGAHVHEAYLVVDKDLLVGFYLPAERGFSPLKHPLPLHFD